MAVAASARALITLDEYKLHKDPSVPVSTQTLTMDDYYQKLINEASQVFRQYCRLPLIYETFTNEEHDGTGKSGSIWLRNYPVVAPGGSVTLTVTEDSGSGAITMTLNTDFKLRKINGELIRISGSARTYWPEGIMNIVGAYTAGHWATVTAVPDDMKALAVEGVDWLNGLGPAVWGARATEMGIIRPDSLPRPIKLGLDSYVRRSRQ